MPCPSLKEPDDLSNLKPVEIVQQEQKEEKGHMEEKEEKEEESGLITLQEDYFKL